MRFKTTVRRLLPALAILLAGVPLDARILDGIVARVGDDVILLSEFELQERIMLQQQPKGDLGKDENRAKYREELLNDMIDERLLLLKGKQLGIQATDKQIDAFVDNIKAQHNLETQDELLAALRLEGLTFEALRNNLSKRIVIETLKQQEIQSLIVTTDEDARNYYEEHRDEITGEGKTRLGEIVLLFDPDKPQEATQREATRVYELLKNGADFAELATFISQTPSREHGGDLGFIEPGMLAPEIEAVAIRLKPGEICEPVKTKFGYHILKILDSQRAVQDSFEQVKPRIQAILKERKGEEIYKDYMKELREQVYIETREIQ